MGSAVPRKLSDLPSAKASMHTQRFRNGLDRVPVQRKKFDHFPM